MRHSTQRGASVTVLAGSVGSIWLCLYSCKDNKWQRKRRVQCQVLSVFLVVIFLILLGLHLRYEEDEGNATSQEPPAAFHNIFTHYATKDACKCNSNEVSCEGISNDAGSYISQFLSEQCSEATTLFVSNSAFFNGTLTAGWLQGLNHSLIKLEINNCNLKWIQEESFNSEIFEHLQILVFQNFPVKELKNGTFRGLREIIALQINDNLNFKYVEPGIMEPMKQIQTLTIENSVEGDVLANFTNSASSNIHTVSIQANIIPYIGPYLLSGLKGVQRLYAKVSGIHDIHPEALKPLSQLEVLDLSVNQITHLPLGLFDSLKGLVNLFLNNNQLKTLHESIFAKITGKLSLQLENNPWNCTCELAWLQRLVYDNQIDILDDPKCAHPDKEANVSLLNVDFSYCFKTTAVSESTTTDPFNTTLHFTTEETHISTENHSISTSSESYPETSSTNQWSSETATYSSTSDKPTTTTTMNEMTSSTLTQFSTELSSTMKTSTSIITKSTTFTSSFFSPTSETTNMPYFSTISCSCDEEPCDEASMTIAIGEVCVNCIKPYRRRLLSMSFQLTNVFMVAQKDTKLEVGVISIDGTSLLLIERTNENVTCYYRVLKEARISNCGYRYCVGFDVKPDTTYTICLVPKNMNVSPLDCQAYTTLPLKEDQAWLLRREIPLVLTICALVLIFTGILGAVISYFLVQRHPSLIKGNKRVVIVGHHAADIMVMPKEYSLHREGQLSRRQSDISCGTVGTNSTSYVDPNEPSPVQLIAWRFNRMWDRLKLNENLNVHSTHSQPPPLPPHPKEKQISSISWDITAAQENSNYTTVLPH